MEVSSEMKARYIERRKLDLEACFVSLAEKKYLDIEKVGHQLKGNGTTFGYPELSAIGKKLEEAASNKDIPQVEEALSAFSQLMKSLN